MCNWSYDLYRCGHKSHREQVNTCKNPEHCLEASCVPRYMELKCGKCRRSSSKIGSDSSRHSSSSKRQAMPLHFQNPSLSSKMHSGINCSNSVCQDDYFDMSSSSSTKDFIPRSSYSVSSSGYDSILSMAASSIPPQMFTESNPVTRTSASPLNGRHSPSLTNPQMSKYMYGDQNFVWHNPNFQCWWQLKKEF